MGFKGNSALSESFQKFVEIRKQVFNYSDKFKLGYIIYIKFLNEFGIIVGRMPNNSNDIRYFVISRRNDSGELGVRYPKEQNLTLVNPDDFKEDMGKSLEYLNSVKERKEFCNDYCIMDCTTCPLKEKYGFGRKVKK